MPSAHSLNHLFTTQSQFAHSIIIISSSLTHALTHSFHHYHSLIHSLTQSFNHHSLSHFIITHSLISSSLTHSFNHHSLTHLFNHYHSLTHLIIITHSLTQMLSLTHWLPLQSLQSWSFQCKHRITPPHLWTVFSWTCYCQSTNYATSSTQSYIWHCSNLLLLVLLLWELHIELQ